MDYEVLDFGLVYYKNVIKDSQLLIDTINDIDSRFLTNEHKDAQTRVKAWSPWSYNDKIFNYQKFFPEPEQIDSRDYYYKEMYEISEALYSSLDKAFKHYAETLYPFAGKNIKNRESSIHLLKYGAGGFLPGHIDQGVSSRVLSSVMYLNDDYDGGEIEFVQSGVKFKPDAGSIIFFPSNFLYVHEVHPIISGYRYSMPHWYHNMREIVRSTGEE